MDKCCSVLRVVALTSVVRVASVKLSGVDTLFDARGSKRIGLELLKKVLRFS